jgi:hypothetical protein
MSGFRKRFVECLVVRHHLKRSLRPVCDARR